MFLIFCIFKISVIFCNQPISHLMQDLWAEFSPSEGFGFWLVDCLMLSWPAIWCVLLQCFGNGFVSEDEGEDDVEDEDEDDEKSEFIWESSALFNFWRKSQMVLYYILLFLKDFGIRSRGFESLDRSSVIVQDLHIWQWFIHECISRIYIVPPQET